MAVDHPGYGLVGDTRGRRHIPDIRGTPQPTGARTILSDQSRKRYCTAGRPASIRTAGGACPWCRRVPRNGAERELLDSASGTGLT